MTLVARTPLPSGVRLCHPVKISEVQLWPFLRMRSIKLAKNTTNRGKISKIITISGIFSQFSAAQREKLVAQWVKNLGHRVTRFRERAGITQL